MLASSAVTAVWQTSQATLRAAVHRSPSATSVLMTMCLYLTIQEALARTVVWLNVVCAGWRGEPRPQQRSDVGGVGAQHGHQRAGGMGVDERLHQLVVVLW